MAEVVIVGGGLAGSEAAFQLAERDYRVVLYEMRPTTSTPAHQTDLLAELVCSNSFKSEEIVNAHGLLKAELRELGSLLLRFAEEARVPAGVALAVDRRAFGELVTSAIAEHPLIEVRRRELPDLPGPPAIVATGPLTSDKLSEAIRRRLGSEGLYFFDAIAPIVAAESIDGERSFRASRYGKGESDAYINCPLTRDEYEIFHDSLLAGETYAAHEWDEVPYFEGCLPIEVLASRGKEALRFGPMKPVGLVDPSTGRRPYAVVQLRQEDIGARMWSLVGFQTRLRYKDQRAAIQTIPALREADILRHGQIHRNSYINFPASLSRHGSPPGEPGVIFAGQMTGVEGYVESVASGLLAAINIDRYSRGLEPAVPPPTTMLGGLLRYLKEADPANFQPMNANFGLVDPPAAPIRDKRLRRRAAAERALRAMRSWRANACSEPVSAGR